MTRPIAIVAVAVIVGLVVDVIVGYSFPGYPAALGLGGTFAIVFFSKWVGTAWLRRDPDYYERGRDG